MAVKEVESAFMASEHALYGTNSADDLVEEGCHLPHVRDGEDWVQKLLLSTVMVT